MLLEKSGRVESCSTRGTGKVNTAFSLCFPEAALYFFESDGVASELEAAVATQAFALEALEVDFGQFAAV